MGLQALCRVTLNGASGDGQAYCGDGELRFKGTFTFRWKWSELTSAVAADGRLTVARPGEEAIFELGGLSEKWSHAIKNPKTRMDKLGVKPGHSYALWGEFDEEFLCELASRAGEPGEEPRDLVFVRLASLDDLAELSRARAQLAPNGAVWAIWTKGQKALNENHVRDFAVSKGLVDVKVASFSPTLSALKLVIPVAQRR